MLKFKDKVILLPLIILGNLPLWFLHGLATVFYVLAYKFIGYRTKVVLQNLKNSFPDRNDKELKALMAQFYKQLCDVFVESLYLLRMTPEESIRRYKFKNTDEIERLYAQGKSIICVTGHYSNWEWSCVGWHQLPHRTIGVYKPLMNKMMDRFFIYLRTKLGSQVVPMQNAFKFSVGALKNQDRFAMLLVGDQRPGSYEIKYWLDFMNQETPVIYGPEKIAKKLDLPVVFFDVQPVKRGYYSVNPVLLTDEPRKTDDFEITHKFFEMLEEQIRKNPAYYLWSHKRWKYTKEQIEKMIKEKNLKVGRNPIR